MGITQHRSKKKPTGARYTCKFPKRLHQKGNLPTNTRIGKMDARNSRVIGGGSKAKLLFADKVNLFDPGSRKHSVESIKTVLESPANRNYVRRNILTRGTIVETSKGRARITGRPGQEGMVNAVLMK